MRRDAPLGRTQQLVLHLLADNSKSVRTLAYDWPGLTENSVRSALERLGMRGLVDLADRHGERGRVYRLTAKGVEVENALIEPDGEEDQ
jgi:predicted ArsR family transcriptional regulator